MRGGRAAGPAGRELGRDDAVALCTAGMALAYVVGDLDDGAALIERALALNPNLAWAWLFSGWVKVWRGEPERRARTHRRARHAAEPARPAHLQHADRDRLRRIFFAGRYGEAQKAAQAALGEQPDYVNALYALAASSALAGQTALARDAMARLRQFDPGARIGLLLQRYPLRRPEDLAKVADGLRRAGMPE